jgi:GTP-binding protein
MQVRAIAQELGKFSDELADKTRWLVLNKCDLLPAEDLPAVQSRIVTELGWQGPVFAVSAATGSGTTALAAAIMREIEEIRELAESDGEPDSEEADR